MSNSLRVRYGRIAVMLAALAAFFALPAVALAQETEIVSSGNTQEAEVEQSASASGGGSAGNQSAIVQQNAGEDAIANINQSQTFGGGVVHENGNGEDNGDVDVDHVGGVGGARVTGVGGVGGGVGGGGVRLAVTGFDAWLLALIGGLGVAGGIGLLAIQRRGRLEA